MTSSDCEIAIMTVIQPKYQFREKHKQQHHIHISSDSLMVQSIELNGFNGNKVIFGEMWASLWFELLSMSCHSSFMMLSIGKYDDKTQPQVHLYSRQRYFMSYESLSYNWPSSNTQLCLRLRVLLHTKYTFEWIKTDLATTRKRQKNKLFHRDQKQIISNCFNAIHFRFIKFVRFTSLVVNKIATFFPCNNFIMRLHNIQNEAFCTLILVSSWKPNTPHIRFQTTL